MSYSRFLICVFCLFLSKIHLVIGNGFEMLPHSHHTMLYSCVFCVTGRPHHPVVNFTTPPIKILSLGSNYLVLRRHKTQQVLRKGTLLGISIMGILKSASYAKNLFTSFPRGMIVRRGVVGFLNRSNISLHALQQFR